MTNQWLVECVFLNRCKGTEAKLTECNCLTDEYAEACGHDGDVGVVCGVPKEDPECHIKDVKISIVNNIYVLEECIVHNVSLWSIILCNIFHVMTTHAIILSDCLTNEMLTLILHTLF